MSYDAWKLDTPPYLEPATDPLDGTTNNGDCWDCGDRVAFLCQECGLEDHAGVGAGCPRCGGGVEPQCASCGRVYGELPEPLHAGEAQW